MGYVSQEPLPEREWVTPAELAKAAGVHPRTVHREIEREHLTATKHGGWVITRAEAERWLTQFSKYAGLRKGDPAEP